ncbi:MAG TPA: DUF1634 domain-containing protein [Acidobacteriaceae bacterium]|jgi:uncharacterized membrane protein|nr:DUF1634 domain-containing protein [Acidobacteriaceae bacterium]
MNATDNPPEHWTDHRIETWVGVMLRTGVMLAAAIVLTGGILYLAHNGGRRPDYSHFHAEPAQFTTLSGVLHGVAVLNPECIIMLGLLVLIATPVARVVMCIVGFQFEGDRLYVAISTVVLAILLYSLFLHR